MAGSGKSRVGVSIGTVSACHVCDRELLRDVSGGQRLLVGDDELGRLAWAMAQLSSSIPLITGNTSVRIGGRLRSAVGSSDWKSARIGANSTGPPGRGLEPRIGSQRDDVLALGEPGSERRKRLDIPGASRGEHHDPRHAWAIVERQPRM